MTKPHLYMCRGWWVAKCSPYAAQRRTPGNAWNALRWMTKVDCAVRGVRCPAWAR